MTRDIRRILIVRTDRIGDVILTLPMAQVLKELSPSLHVSMLIRQYTRELVEGNRYVNDVLYYDSGGRQVEFWKMVNVLRSGSFEAVVLTYPRFRLALLMMLAGIPIRIGTGYRWYSFLFTDRVYEHRKNARLHELEYNLHLLRVLDSTVATAGVQPVLTVDDDARSFVVSLLRSRGVSDRHRIVIVHPGTGGSARDWSASHFHDLVCRLAQIHDVKVIVTGGQEEQHLVEKVSGSEPNVIPMAGILTLRQLAALASLARVFVANSTGPLHIAAAVGTFVIGLYPQVTALSPTRWSPVTAKKIVFSPSGKPSDCRKCESGGMTACECMDSISVDAVFDATNNILMQL